MVYKMTKVAAMRTMFTRIGFSTGVMGYLVDEGGMSEPDRVALLQDKCIENLVKKL
jgi:hypothetical protein